MTNRRIIPVIGALLLGVALALPATARTWRPEEVPNVQLRDARRYVSNPDGILPREAVVRLDSICGSLRDRGLALEPNPDFADSREHIVFKNLSAEEKNALIQKDPRYGRVVCRCETITEGEIVAALHSPIPPYSINGVKRRCNAGMGRCQGGFCGPRVQEIIARELGLDQTEVLLDQAGTYILTEKTKMGGKADV